MNTQTMAKTDFIKFNVSPLLKSRAEKKAREYGMTLSELGRMLFGTFITGIAQPTISISPKFLKLAEQAKKDHEAGKGKLITSRDELETFLHTI
jgi:antitoxin component of RelBE/YafQ-DinJ toxin-antitoxin module